MPDPKSKVANITSKMVKNPQLPSALTFSIAKKVKSDPSNTYTMPENKGDCLKLKSSNKSIYNLV